MEMAKFVGTNQRKSKQVERNPLAKLELNTMLTEDKKTYTYTTHQTKNFKSEVETKTNGDKFDSNAIAKHHRWKEIWTMAQTKKKNPLKRFHFQWQRTFEYLAFGSDWEAFAFFTLCLFLDVLLSLLLCQKPSGWKETNPSNHSLKSR